jgi:hypothetical protein
MFDSKPFMGFLGLLGVLGISLFIVSNSITGTLKEEINFVSLVLLGIFAFIAVLKIVDAKLQESQED